MKHNRLMGIISIGGLAALTIMLVISSPTEIGPLGVLLFFTILYITLFGGIAMLMGLFYRLAFKRENFRNKDYLYAVVLAFGPIMMLMARSFGAITPWTVTLILLFLALAEFLVYKRI